MFTLPLTSEKNITVVINDYLSDKATKISKREIIVFTTDDPLVEGGGAMAFGLISNGSILPAIILSDTGFKNREVRKSILFHEIGHVVHDHIRKPAFEMSDSERTMAEFEADAFMAAHLGKFAAINALSGLAALHPTQKNQINIRICAIFFGKWCWRFFRNSLFYIHLV